MASNPPKDDFLKGKPTEMIEKLNEIIDELKRAGIGNKSLELETMIILWLKSVLERFGGELGEFPDFSTLEPSKKAELMKEIEQLLNQLKQKGVLSSSDDIIKLLIENIFQSFNKAKKTELEQELDYEFLTEKDKKRVRDELIRAAIYEVYKQLSPRRLAGETLLENFLNNVLVRGFAAATQYEGGKPKDIESYGLSGGVIGALERAHQGILKDPGKFEQYVRDTTSHLPDFTKGGGGGRGM